MIRRWNRARFVAFSAIVGVAAFFLSVGVAHFARRAGRAARTRRELVMSTGSASQGAIAVYAPRLEKTLTELDAEAAAERRRQLSLELALGAVVVVWAGVARAWLGRHRATPAPG